MDWKKIEIKPPVLQYELHLTHSEMKSIREALSIPCPTDPQCQDLYRAFITAMEAGILAGTSGTLGGLGQAGPDWKEIARLRGDKLEAIRTAVDGLKGSNPLRVAERIKDIIDRGDG